jgi:hypothetical protein
MTPAAAIPTVTLNDEHAIPVLGLSVSALPPAMRRRSGALSPPRGSRAKTCT